MPNTAGIRRRLFRCRSFLIALCYRLCQYSSSVDAQSGSRFYSVGSSIFYAPVTIVRGHKELTLSVRLSVCLSVRPFVTLYGIEFV